MNAMERSVPTNHSSWMRTQVSKDTAAEAESEIENLTRL